MLNIPSEIPTQPDYLIVGSGLTGATIARLLVDAGKKVVVVDRRDHLGGNVYDHLHSSGIRVHTYGPHYFRTSSENLWQFVRRFSDFYPYEVCLKSLVDGQLENWPIAGSYIREKVGGNWKPEFQGVPSNFEEACLAMMPRLVYENFVKGYTEKQWGVPAAHLIPALARRFDVREDDEPRLTRHKYQALPRKGYAYLMQSMLAGIPTVLKFDYTKNRSLFRPKTLTVFTGPIDEAFDFKLGRLAYRGQMREESYLQKLGFYQTVGQVNNPSSAFGAHIRTMEWKHMMPPEDIQALNGTVITRETTITPTSSNDYEYPFPDSINQQLFVQYQQLARQDSKLLICGRLGEYRYFDMDQAIARAMLIAKKMLAGGANQELLCE